MLDRLCWIATGVILFGTLLFVSCTSPTGTIIKSATAPITTSKEQVGSSAASLDTTTKDIQIHANAILVNTPPQSKGVLDPHTTQILKDTGTQEGIVKNLLDTQKLLSQAETTSQTFEKAFLTEQTARKKAEESETKALKQRYIALSVLCFVGAIACSVLFFTGHVWAKSIGMVCAAGCAGCIFIVQTLSLIPWIVGGLIIIAVGIGIWQYLSKNKTIKTQVTEVKNLVTQNSVLHTAAKELVETVEAQKTLHSAEARKVVFGDGPRPGFARYVQSPATRELVKTLRAELTNVAPTVPETVSIGQEGVPLEKTFRPSTQAVYETPCCAPSTEARPRGCSGKRKIGAGFARKTPVGYIVLH